MNDADQVAAAFSTVLASYPPRFVVPFADRFESSVEILRLSEALVVRQHADPGAAYEEGDVLVWGIGARTIKTYRAAMCLASIGHGTQAVMLGRTMIEDALTVAWLDANRNEALKQMNMHERHYKHLWRKLLDERNVDLGVLADLAPLEPDELDTMIDNFGRFGQWSWTGHKSLRSLYEAVRQDWDSPNERALLDHMVEVDLRYASLRTHNTALSIGRPQDIGTAHFYNTSESTDDIAVALLLGFWAFAHTTKHLFDAPYRDEFMALYHERMPSFFRS